jgi:hypothetical protein
MADFTKPTTVIFRFDFKASPQARVSRNNNQTLSVGPEQSPLMTAVNYVIGDIAFKATNRQEKEIQAAIRGRFAGIAHQELSKMGQKITKYGVGVGPRSRYPATTLQIEGAVSNVMRKFAGGPHAPHAAPVRQMMPMWRDRTRGYLERKRRKYGHNKWWLNSGQLRDALRNPSLYTSSYGPVSVKWIPHKKGNDPFTARYSTFARGRGRAITSLQVGRIELSILGRITTSMLAPPDQMAHNSARSGLFASMPEDIENKLLGRWGPRVLVEPFLTYYINRQIPNRIFREIEKSLKSV